MNELLRKHITYMSLNECNSMLRRRNLSQMSRGFIKLRRDEILINHRRQALRILYKSGCR